MPKRLENLFHLSIKKNEFPLLPFENSDERKIRMVEYFHDVAYFCNLYKEEIITADRDEMKTIWQTVLELFGEDIKTKTVIRLIQNYMNYDQFKKGETYNNATFVASLELRVCPYCNRQYTLGLSHKGKKMITPQLDHYYPRGVYPLFGVSFYNLVPSCSYCNVLKRDFDTMEKPHFHPYFDKEEPCFKISCIEAKPSKDASKYNFKIVSDNKKLLENSERAFKLTEFYKEHDYEFKKLIEKFMAYPVEYIDSMKDYLDEYKSLNFRDLEMDIFQVVPKDQHGMEPLDKFRTDLYLSLKKLWMESMATEKNNY